MPAVVDAGAGLWIVVADAPLDRYGPGRLEASLRDLNWVAEIAVAHESVVEYFASRPAATVVPMKLFTMFSTLERAAGDVRARRREMEAIFERIAGCEEWGVRVMRAAPTPTRRSPQAAGARSGVAFLAAKKRARDEAHQAARAAAEAAGGAYTVLADLARDARRRDDVPESAATPPLLDAAFLVPAGKRTRFKAAARRAAAACAAAGAQLTLSGPWPAYNFVQPPEERA